MPSRIAYAPTPVAKLKVAVPATVAANNAALPANVVATTNPVTVLPAIANIVAPPSIVAAPRTPPIKAPDKAPLQKLSPFTTAETPPTTPPTSIPTPIAINKLIRKNVPLGSLYITGLLPQ